MTIKLEIHPSSSSLDLLGPPDASSAYSLSGYVSISLTSSQSVFERRRAVCILLRSLVITFEGQAELVATEAGGYFATRLCSISRELVSKSTVELSNEGGEDRDQPSTWHVMFNLPIPGWLPASDLYGDCKQGVSGTQYNLYATMKYTNAVEDAHHGPIWLSALCSPFSSRNKVAHARPCPVALNRFALPQSAASCRPSVYTVRASGKEVRTENQRPPIPEDIVSKIEMLASVPECVSVDGDRFPFSLSIRSPSLSDEQASKLRVSHMSLHLLQIDQYSSTSTEYATSYPIPRQKEQPPHKALRSPHPVSGLYDVGLLGSPLKFTFDDVHSLLPPGFSYIDVPLDKGEHASKCADGLRQDQWLTVEVNVPYVQTLPKCKDVNLEWIGIPHLRTTSQGPLFGVKHSISVVATFEYDAGDSEPSATSSLSFTLPLNFVRLRGAPPCADSQNNQSPAPDRLSSPDTSSSVVPVTMPTTHPYHNTPELPPYSQLFYPNGDAKYDDSIPLPLYTASPASSSSTLDDVDDEDGRSSSETSCLLSDSSSSSSNVTPAAL